jgi:hypothetical protein
MTDLVLDVRTKFPFWSAIITQQAGSVSVPASSSAVVNIQPPAGETWFIDIAFTITYTTSTAVFKIRYYDFDGTTARLHALHEKTLGSFLVITRILTNSLYAQLYAYNSESASQTMYYGYSGFKLSEPLYSPKRSNTVPKPWKRKPSLLSIPKDIMPLKDYIVDIYDHAIGDYRQAIILEEDTPLAYDPKTNFPVERLTVYVFVDDFIDNILTPYKAGKLDLVKSGWKKYFDKWASEGITL